MSTAELIVRIFQIYAAVGVVFAVAFVARGAARLDPAARNASTGFRLVIFPGAAALWPVLLLRWAREGVR